MRYIIYKKVKYRDDKEYNNYYINFALFTLDITGATRYKSEIDAVERYQFETFYKLKKLEKGQDCKDKDIITVAYIDDECNIISESKYYKI